MPKGGSDIECLPNGLWEELCPFPREAASQVDKDQRLGIVHSGKRLQVTKVCIPFSIPGLDHVGGLGQRGNSEALWTIPRALCPLYSR